MIIKNHIAYRFLTDDTLHFELMETMFPKQWQALINKEKSSKDIGPEIAAFYALVSPKDQKAYYVTETVMDKLDLLKVNKKQTDKGEHYDWTVFKDLPDCKKTFIMPDNRLLRIFITQEAICFCYITFKKDPNNKHYGRIHWVLFYVSRDTGEQCDHFQHQDVQSIETFVYKLLCFVFLSENEEIVIKPGAKVGTRKQGKIINPFSDIPLTVINSRWNITTIRDEQFTVSGHFAIRWTSEGRKIAKMVWINPFIKEGYVRKAKNLSEI